jgi:peptidoglycan/xylan/chitin deacetylase (PgdA/CDA1 family)
MFLSILIGFLIIVAVADALGFLFWYACSWPRSQVLGPALVRGPAGSRKVALTFDDGPLPPYTGQILDILRSRSAKATFFVCGKDAEQHPEILRRMCSEGHTIGNHTWSHPYLYFMNRAKCVEEIERTQRMIQQATGSTPRFFRPPYGARWFGLYPVLRERGLQLVQWSANGDDWMLEANAIVAAVRAGLRPGAIILLHDGRQKPGGYLKELVKRNIRAADSRNRQPDPDASETVKALPAIIDAVREMGYEFASVEEFFPFRSRGDNLVPK